MRLISLSYLWFVPLSLLTCPFIHAESTAFADSTAFIVETIAGNGQPGDLPAGGGAALAVPVDQPFGVELGPDGALYITSVGQHRVLRLDRATGKITSVAGNGTKGYSGDGQAASGGPVE